MNDTPRTDEVKSRGEWFRLRDISRTLERELAEARRELERVQSNLDSTSRKLVDALNRANSTGVQLDLIRDELKRIRARIIESKWSDDPHLSNIVDYCTRSQEDIATTYSVIDERDRLEAQLTAHKEVVGMCEEALKQLIKFGDSVRDCLFEGEGMEYHEWIARSSDSARDWKVIKDSCGHEALTAIAKLKEGK